MDYQGAAELQLALRESRNRLRHPVQSNLAMTTASPLLQAVQSAARKLASSGKFENLLKDVLAICVEAAQAGGGTIYLHDSENSRLRFRHVLPPDVKLPSDIPDDYGVAGRVFQTRKTEISNFDSTEQTEIEKTAGVSRVTMITVPLSMEDELPIGVVQLLNKRNGEFDKDDALVLDTVAAISTMAYLNSRLLDEQGRASTLLGMGKVAHDIKNMAFALEANMLFSDQMLQGLRSHVVDFAKEDEVLIGYSDSIESMFEELKDSIDRVKRYSILMSDLSAGKGLQPIMKLGPLAETIERSAAYLESEGRNNFVSIRYEIQKDAPPLVHDEMYLFRIVQNLVSNAIKAVGECVPEDWKRQFENEDGAIFDEVAVRYCFDGRAHLLEVEDHGPGMDRATADRILSGNMRSNWETKGGSGWGTKIVLELAATHSADVSIESEIGKGTTFRLRFPPVEAETTELTAQ